MGERRPECKGQLSLDLAAKKGHSGLYSILFLEIRLDVKLTGAPDWKEKKKKGREKTGLTDKEKKKKAKSSVTLHLQKEMRPV